PAILVISDENFDKVEYDSINVDFSHLENIQGKFGIIKKILNLVLATSRIEELYKIHKNFTTDIKIEITNKSRNGDNIAEFIFVINNPIEIRTKGQPKESNHVNTNIKGKRKQVFSSNQNNENKIRRPRKVLDDVDLNSSKSSKNKRRK
ncbi:132_t:CDS:2, partial [Racocetra fulgida]